MVVLLLRLEAGMVAAALALTLMAPAAAELLISVPVVLRYPIVW